MGNPGRLTLGAPSERPPTMLSRAGLRVSPICSSGRIIPKSRPVNDPWRAEPATRPLPSIGTSGPSDDAR
jgi:hypothetical protein